MNKCNLQSTFISAGGAGCHAITANTAQNESSALGILTKSCATPDFKGLAEIALRRATNYALQNEAVKLLPNERVRFCLRHRVDASKGIEIKYNEKREKAHYSNVQRCGSVWVCPICSAQISEGRRQELKQGMAHWQRMGSDGAVYLLTLTNPHHNGDNLAQLLEGQKRHCIGFGRYASRVKCLSH